MLRYVTLRYVYVYVTLRYVVLRCVTLRYVVLRCVTIRYVTLRYVTLCYVMLCYVMLFSDIDECITGTHHCSADAVCNNTKGSYNCTCNPGYNGDGRNCQGEIKALRLTNSINVYKPSSPTSLYSFIFHGTLITCTSIVSYSRSIVLFFVLLSSQLGWRETLLNQQINYCCLERGASDLKSL